MFVVLLWRLILPHLTVLTACSDGLHLSTAGNTVVFELLVKVLEDPAGSGSLPVDYPEHSAVDPDNPAKSFADW